MEVCPDRDVGGHVVGIGVADDDVLAVHLGHQVWHPENLAKRLDISTIVVIVCRYGKDVVSTNALAPIEFIFADRCRVLFLILLGTGIAAVAGRTLPGEGDAVCVTAPVTAINGHSGHDIARIVDDSHSGERPDLLHSGTDASATSVELCDSSPSRTQHLWSSAMRMSPFAYTGGFLVFAFMLTRSARRYGLFSPHVALGVGQLGLYVLLGYVALTVVRMWTQIHLMRSMTNSTRSGSGTTSWTSRGRSRSRLRAADPQSGDGAVGAGCSARSTRPYEATYAVACRRRARSSTPSRSTSTSSSPTAG